MNQYTDNEYIYLSLLYLGANVWNKSAKRLLHTLQYATSYEIASKHLYAELSTSQNCTYSAIERSLRYAIGRMWECSHTECSKLLYRKKHTAHCPSVSEFIFLYADAFKRGEIQAWVDSIDSEK